MKYGFATPFAASQEKADYSFLSSIKAAGYDYVELPGTLIGHLRDQDFKELTDFLQSIDLKCTNICALLPAKINCFTSDRTFLNEYLCMLFERFYRLGVESVGFGSGGARRLSEPFNRLSGKELFSSVLTELFLPHLTEKNMLLNIEPLRTEECNFINRISEAAELIADLNDSHFGIVADTMHMISAEDHDLSLPSYKPFIRHVHISELDRNLPVKSYSSQCLSILSQLRDMGYDQSVSFETKCDSMEDLSFALDTLKLNLTI